MSAPETPAAETRDAAYVRGYLEGLALAHRLCVDRPTAHAFSIGAEVSAAITQVKTDLAKILDTTGA